MAAEYTPNLNLKKPDPDDFYNVVDFNNNADIIDAAVTGQAAGITALQQTINTHLADDVQHITAAERTAWDAKISASLLTTKGDLLYHNGTGLARLPRGTTGQILKVKSDGSLEWGELDVIQPSKPFKAQVKVDLPSTNTWYTVVNVSSGKGILNRIAVTTGSSSYDSIEIRVTVDGTAYTFSNFNEADNFQSYNVDVIPMAYFNSSLLIEIKTTKSANALIGSANYTLE